MDVFSAVDENTRSAWILLIIFLVTVLFAMEGQYTQGLLIAEKSCVEKKIGKLKYSNPMMKDIISGGQWKMIASYFGCFLLLFYISSTAKETALRSSLVAFIGCPAIIYYIIDGFIMKKFIEENKENKCYTDEINKGFYHGYFKAYPYKWAVSGFLFMITLVGIYRSGL